MGASKTLTWPLAILYAALAIAGFHLAFAVGWSALILLFLFGIIPLTQLNTARKAFYFGVVIGMLIYAPHLAFFWGIFRWTAVVLWLVPSFWLGLFLALGRSARLRFGDWGLLILPIMWTGIEYFRSELYYLKFSWLSVGYAFSNSSILPTIGSLGVYGISFCVTLIVAALHVRSVRPMVVSLFVLALAIVFSVSTARRENKGTSMRVAGVQLEFPAGVDVPRALDQALAKSPNADVFLLSEYTFHMPVPNFVRKWCAQHHKHLVVGGTDPLPANKFYDTAFVIGPQGDVVFKQAKCVPVQFFDDGLPAKEQKLWNSPWGKIGMGICYDCSYRRVTDELVRQGAQAFIFPTMDAIDWGAYEHGLHSRVGPMRAAELGVPVMRIASSGVSQIVSRDGTVQASAPFPGQGNFLIGDVTIGAPARLPLDHWLGPICTALTAVLLLFFLVDLAFQSKPGTPSRATLRVPIAKL